MTIQEAKTEANRLFQDLAESGPDITIEDAYELLFFNARRQNDLGLATTYMHAFREEKGIIDPTTWND